MAVLDRVPVDRISIEARQIHFGRALLTLIAALLYLIGWVPGKLTLALAWCAAAVKVGWVEAHRPAGGG